MNTLLRYYEASFIMRSKDYSTLRIVDLWTFRSAKSHKRYIVEVEHFSHRFLGMKFYWKGVADSPLRYSLLTNDYEPRVIIMSCVNIMLKYYNEDRFASFGFVAAGDIENINDGHRKIPNKRFRFYRAMMLSIFGKQTFVQGWDVDNSLYILVNRSMIINGFITTQELEKEISRLYEGEYSLQIEG